ncbi:MAG: YihY/virulence factor BrkB family protein [Actinomycetota bacterium]
MSGNATVARSKQLAGQVVESHPVRAWKCYGAARGDVLAGGIAYAGLFSVFSALLVGFTILGLVLGRRFELREEVLAAVDEQLPGLLDVEGTGDGLVDPDALFAENVLSATGLVALLVALFAGLGWLDAAREGIRAVFDLGTDDRPLPKKKAADVAILATLGLAILASAVVSVGVNAAAGALLESVGLERGWLGQGILRVLGVLLVLAADTAIFVILLRLLSRVPLTWAQVRAGALVGAAGLGVLKLFGGLLLGRVGGGNPLLAASATLVGLLLWMNLVSRVTLLAAAWVASEESVEATVAQVPGRRVRAGAGQDLPAAAGPRDLMAPSFGQRSRDRVTLAAGAVLGALAVTSMRVLVGGARAIGDVVRRSD